MLRRSLAALLIVTLAWLAPAPATAAPPQPPDATTQTISALHGADSTLLTHRSTPIAPGLTLTSFQRLQPGGWVTGHVMNADLTTPTLGLDLADGGTVSGSNDTVENFATQAHAVAAVNGDYFDMNATDAPAGTNVSSAGVRTIAATPRPSFTVAEGRAAVQQLMSSASLTWGDTSVPVAAVNHPRVAENAATLYTEVWGGYSLAASVPPDDESLRVVHIRDEVVIESTTDRARLTLTAPLAPGESLLVARGTAAVSLAPLAPGDAVDVTVGTSATVDLAVGGQEWLVRDGVPTTADAVTAARTAVGVSKDGTRITVVSIDGRQGDAHGMTMLELAAFMRDLGAYNALNLDGGGSSTLLARPAGTTSLQLVNRPSDGTQRPVTNALVFTSSAAAAAPKPDARGVQIRPALQSAAGLENPGATLLMPGLSRTVAVTGLDADLAATPVTGKLASSRDDIVRPVDKSTAGPLTVVRGVAPGVATLDYFAKLTKRGAPARDTLDLRVVGPIARLDTSAPTLALESDTSTARISLEAIDADGNRVPVEPADVQVTAAPGVAVSADGLAGFAVAAEPGARSSAVTFAVLGQSVTVPVTIGFDVHPVTDFADPAAWVAATARAAGSLAPATGPEGGPALALDFDFTQTTATRGMYANPVTPLAVAGQPQSFTLWINGDGQGEWPRLQVTKGDGTSTNLDAPNVDWTGWRQVTFPVPPGTPYPLSITALRFMETRSTVTYTGHLEVADVVAQVPVPVDLPDAAPVTDPVILTQGTVADRPLRIGVISDSQFVARNGDDHPVVLAARRTLREIVAARPDLIVVDGDFVDEASPADFALAKRVLDEEVGDAVPFIYVPGNHEIMGGPIENFAAVFGATNGHRVVKNTLIVTLDSSTGTLHPGGSTTQLRMLEGQLGAAASDPNITGVLVINHHPIDDFQPDQASQLADRYEAHALAALLTRWQRTAGKPIAQVNGHIGSFHGSVEGGVSRLVNGNSGKSPSGTPAAGGFTGWTLVGIDPAARDRLGWLRAETKPRVDGLSVDAPVALTVGGRGSVAATIEQDGVRSVPVAWPVSAVWSVSDPSVLEFDPATREVVGLREGVATVSVTVNGVAATAEVTVGGE
ncbi:phosphodiester glycosidase family protein [Micrococcales bacterium 31B]|nr:phosphodiester glycosidase family protein [Micrococcales bacterium 31B]